MERASHRRDTRKKFCHAMSRHDVTGGNFDVKELFQSDLFGVVKGLPI
jgi:hypothetical protein